MLHRALYDSSPQLERESRLLWVLAQLIVRHSDVALPEQLRRQERRSGGGGRALRSAG